MLATALKRDRWCLICSPQILKRLGAHEAKDVPSCTHLVADSFGRTKNMLEAMVGAKKIVTPSWLESCGQAHYFEDEAPHMLKV
jgi:hypothetical protein